MEILFIMSNVIGTVCLCLLTYYVAKDASNRKNAKRYVDVDIIDIRTTFDNIINDEINTYFRFHPELVQEGETYLKENDINEIIVDITSRVMQNVTPVLRNNLSFAYNLGDDDVALTNIVGEKVGLVIIGMAAKINNSMADEVIIKK